MQVGENANYNGRLHFRLYSMWKWPDASKMTIYSFEMVCEINRRTEDLIINEDFSISQAIYVFQSLLYTVEPPITDPPRSGQPLYNGQAPCYGLKSA